MSFDTRIARLFRRHGPPKPFLLTVENSPEGDGDDDGLICGEHYQRAPDETLAVFHDRLLTCAEAKGAPFAAVGSGPSRRKEITALRCGGLTVET